MKTRLGTAIIATLVAVGTAGIVAATAWAAADFVPVPSLDKYLTPENIKKLEDGEIVKDTVLSSDATKGDKGRGIGFVYIKAKPDKIQAAVHDFGTYPSWMPNVKTTKVTNKTAERVDVEFMLSIMGNEIQYTTIHKVNPDGTIQWRLDDAKPKKNVSDSVGAWVFKPHGEGTIVAYVIDVDTGMSVPKIIQNFLTNQSLKSVLKALRDRVGG